DLSRSAGRAGRLRECSVGWSVSGTARAPVGGRFAALEDVVALLDRGGGAMPNRSPRFAPLGLFPEG
ncbi:MAG TPA: hypothetical protein VK997_05040, partial [Deferrisomatales bacterium]|nr:hypothetical protein [Deferrisomatales bacterium]